MATRKAPRKAPAATQVLETLQQNLRRLQTEAEATLSHATQRASKMITKDRQRAVGRLVGEAQRVRVDLQKRAARTSKNLEIEPSASWR